MANDQQHDPNDVDNEELYEFGEGALVGYERLFDHERDLRVIPQEEPSEF